MNLIEYLLPQPLFDLTSEKREAFESLIASSPPGSFIDYQLLFPKWQFLSYLYMSRELVLYSSHQEDIEILEPQQVHGHDDEKLSRLSAEDPGGFHWPEALIT